ncbi:heterokaryon incompatibility, partial [Decorospora gaudefroyi]
EVRLLSLLPGRYDDDIQCRLVHSKLLENTNFEALSYTWGDSNLKLRSVILNGIRFPVTPNLWDALATFRSETVDRVLWIDALCINQSDNDEKSVQIQLMREIYRSTSQVLIWLGEASSDSALAMDFIKEIPRIDLENGREVEWLALERLFRRPWWTRSWV